MSCYLNDNFQLQHFLSIKATWLYNLLPLHSCHHNKYTCRIGMCQRLKLLSLVRQLLGFSVTHQTINCRKGQTKPNQPRNARCSRQVPSEAEVSPSWTWAWAPWSLVRGGASHCWQAEHFVGHLMYSTMGAPSPGGEVGWGSTPPFPAAPGVWGWPRTGSEGCSHAHLAEEKNWIYVSLELQIIFKSFLMQTLTIEYFWFLCFQSGFLVANTKTQSSHEGSRPKLGKLPSLTLWPLSFISVTGCAARGRRASVKPFLKTHKSQLSILKGKQIS